MGVHWKTNIEGGLPKRGAWTVCWFKGGGACQEREGWCFWGWVDTPMHAMGFSSSYAIVIQFIK